MANPNDDDPRDEPGDDSDKDRDREGRVRQKLDGLIPDIVKRTIFAGLGAAFTTEEAIRKAATDFSLPKDVANYLLSSAQATKDEIFRIFARETREFLKGLNLTQEVARLLTTLSFEIKTEIRFIPNDESITGVKREMKNRVSVKRKREDGTTITEPIVDDEDETKPPTTT